MKVLSVLWDAVLKAGPWHCFKAAGELGGLEALRQECRLKPNLDGQPNFWSALRRLRKSLAPPCFRICRGDAGQDMPGESVKLL